MHYFGIFAEESPTPTETSEMHIPERFIERTRSILGEDETIRLCTALEAEPPVSIRLNRSKTAGATKCGTPVGWCEAGYYLPTRPAFTFDPLLHAGAYYVQEAASMFIEQAFKKMEDVHRVLDLCAAPGGKSTLWRSLLPDGALLVANEPIRQRAVILAENLTKWGHPDVAVTNAYPADFSTLPGFFDVIAADVPCSGEGMFRKDDGARSEWSEENVALCASRQWEIISDSWDALRTGGYLVYSTCTFNREENEDNVVRICKELGAEPVAIDCPGEWNVSGDTTGRRLDVYHFFPHKSKGEGFFLALLRKTSEAPVLREKKKKQKGGREQAVQGSAIVSQWLSDADNFRILRSGEQHLVAVRKSLADDFERIASAIHTLQAGIILGEEKGKKIVPQQSLALSTARNKRTFPEIPLTYEQAIAYLRHESVVLPQGTPNGHVIATYDGCALGFLNQIGNRANNLYPAEWRIRTTHTPAEQPQVLAD